MRTLEEQLALIKRGSVEIINEEGLKKKISFSIKTKKPLVVKAGFDPTAPDIHLGHTVLLRKLRHFQDCGHQVQFLIGDATALVGDPTGKSQIRKMMTWDEVIVNAKTYEQQVKKLLLTDAKHFKRVHNSQWFGKKNSKIFGFDDFVELAQKYTVARLLERDDFEKRMKENKPISFIELFYPLMQGFDSVKMKADIELGGTDQKFNMLVGRNLQQAYGDAPQIVITMPLLEGTDGVDKMSKSLDNYIGIDEKPDDMFGKIMSISDDMMMKYYELLTDVPLDKIKKGIQNGSIHPKEAKKELAGLIVGQYHSKEAASAAEVNFEKIFAKGQNPENMTEIYIAENELTAAQIIKKTGIISSGSEIKRLFLQGAVTFDGTRVEDPSSLVTLTSDGIIVKIGKRRFAKIVKK